LTIIDPMVCGGLKTMMHMDGFQCDGLLRSHQGAKIQEDG